MPISHHIDLYRYWLAKRADRRMPARRDLDPCDIPKLLPYVMIVEKADDRFRWRLVGSAVAREAGRDLTAIVSVAGVPFEASTCYFELGFRDYVGHAVLRNSVAHQAPRR